MGTTDIAVTGTEGNTAVAQASKASVARVRKGVQAPAVTPKGKVAPYAVATENVAPQCVAAAGAAWAQGKRGTDLAHAIAPVRAKYVPGATGCTPGQATHLAMLAGCAAYRGSVVPLATYGTDAKGAPKTPATLALAIAAMRNAGHSWVAPRVRYGITEAGCRAAYAAATGTDPRNTGVGAWAWRQAPGK